MKKIICWIGFALLCACAWAQTVPSGWKIVKGGFTPGPGQNAQPAPNACQIAVPANWTSFVMPNNVHTPHSMSFSATVTASKPGLSFADEVRYTKGWQKRTPVQGQTVVEDSAKRYWTETKSGGTTNWNVTGPGTPVCNLQVSFSDAADAAAAKKIVMSLGPAK